MKKAQTAVKNSTNVELKTSPETSDSGNFDLLGKFVSLRRFSSLAPPLISCLFILEALTDEANAPAVLLVAKFWLDFTSFWL